MNRIAFFVFAALSGVLIMGCGDPQEFAPKALGPFNVIQSNGGVKFKLVSGATNQVISTSLSESMYNVSSGVLSVNAAGGVVTVAIRNLNLLSCNACTVENPSPLVADTLVMYIHAGSANLQNIQINHYLGLSALNTGKYKFSGTAAFFNVANVNATSVEAFDLVTDSTYVNSTNIFETDVNATQVINVFINSIGDVNYKGNPPIVRLTATGSGKLKKM